MRPARAEITACGKAGRERSGIKKKRKPQRRDIMRETPSFKNPPADWPCQGRVGKATGIRLKKFGFSMYNPDYAKFHGSAPICRKFGCAGRDQSNRVAA